MRAYRRVTEDYRIEIYALLKAGESQASISRALGFDKSTIHRPTGDFVQQNLPRGGRELRRNSGKNGYRAKQAHRFSVVRRTGIHRRRVSRSQWRVVEAGLRQDGYFRHQDASRQPA